MKPPPSVTSCISQDTIYSQMCLPVKCSWCGQKRTCAKNAWLRVLRRRLREDMKKRVDAHQISCVEHQRVPPGYVLVASCFLPREMQIWSSFSFCKRRRLQLPFLPASMRKRLRVPWLSLHMRKCCLRNPAARLRGWCGPPQKLLRTIICWNRGIIYYRNLL